MDYEFHREWLVKKFTEIQRRIVLALEQLDDAGVNWQPNSSSNSISTLIRHIAGNIGDRIAKGILLQDVETRNRAEEFRQTDVAKEQLANLIQERLDFAVRTVAGMQASDFERTQTVRGKERTGADMLYQCAAHYSEHMGQILYIAKMLVEEKYKSTSI
jgi:uncharacterized damage-inducible protein DinB